MPKLAPKKTPRRRPTASKAKAPAKRRDATPAKLTHRQIAELSQGALRERLDAKQLAAAALDAVRASSYHHGFENGKHEPRGTSAEALGSAMITADDELHEVVQDIRTVCYAVRAVVSDPDDRAALEGTLLRAEYRLGDVMKALDAARVAVREQVTS